MKSPTRKNKKTRSQSYREAKIREANAVVKRLSSEDKEDILRSANEWRIFLNEPVFNSFEQYKEFLYTKFKGTERLSTTPKENLCNRYREAKLIPVFDMMGRLRLDMSNLDSFKSFSEYYKRVSDHVLDPPIVVNDKWKPTRPREEDGVVREFLVQSKRLKK